MKSGKDYQRHNALNNVMNNEGYEIKEAFVFTGENLRRDGRFNYLPIYLVGFLQRENIGDIHYDVSLEGL